ncbi:MAG TPA: hypothetical protein PLK31_13640 [Chloroflexota bacterium]|nr:hypothetical protein [Chloroflexota bacterium]
MDENPIFFDFSKLKPSGFHYVAVDFSLPYSLHVSEDSYDVDVSVGKNQLRVQLFLENRWRNQNRRTDFPLVVGERIERFADVDGAYRYTTIKVFIPVRSERSGVPQDIEATWKKVSQDRYWYRDLAIQATNRLLEIYRFCAKEPHIKALTGRELKFDFRFVLLFNQNHSDATSSNFTVKISPTTYWGDMYPSFQNVPNVVEEDLRNRLKSHFQVPLAENLILNAYEHIAQGNYRLAIIETETAFEAAVHEFLQSFYIQDPNMLSEIERLNRDGFTNVVKSRKLRPAFNGKKFTDNVPEFESWRKKVMELRNQLVHGKKEVVTKQEAIDAINTIEQVLSFLLARAITKPYQFLEVSS